LNDHISQQEARLRDAVAKLGNLALTVDDEPFTGSLTGTPVLGLRLGIRAKFQTGTGFTYPIALTLPEHGHAADAWRDAAAQANLGRLVDALDKGWTDELPDGRKQHYLGLVATSDDVFQSVILSLAARVATLNGREVAALAYGRSVPIAPSVTPEGAIAAATLQQGTLTPVTASNLAGIGAALDLMSERRDPKSRAVFDVRRQDEVTVALRDSFNRASAAEDVTRTLEDEGWRLVDDTAADVITFERDGRIGNLLRDSRLEEHARRVADAMADALAPSTRRAYAGALTRFDAWCGRDGFDPRTPDAVAAYVAQLGASGRSVSTVAIVLAAVRYRALAEGSEDLTQHRGVRLTAAGVRRQLAGQPRRRAHALTTAELARIVDGIDQATVAGRRDAALLLLLYAGAFRRSEVAALTRRDLKLGADGLVVTVRKSKTDQEGAGQVVGIARGANPRTDPVAAVSRWLATLAPAADEPVFVPVTRTGAIVRGRAVDGRTIARVLQARAVAADLTLPGLSGHSGRAGHITTAAATGVPLDRIARTSRHRSLSVLAEYVRPATVLGDTSSADLGL